MFPNELHMEMKFGACALDNCSPILKSRHVLQRVQHGPQMLFFSSKKWKLKNEFCDLSATRPLDGCQGPHQRFPTPDDHWRVRPTAPMSMLEQPFSCSWLGQQLLQCRKPRLAEINTWQLRRTSNHVPNDVNLVAWLPPSQSQWHLNTHAKNWEWTSPFFSQVLCPNPLHNATRSSLVLRLFSPTSLNTKLGSTMSGDAPPTLSVRNTNIIGLG